MYDVLFIPYEWMGPMESFGIISLWGNFIFIGIDCFTTITTINSTMVVYRYSL